MSANVTEGTDRVSSTWSASATATGLYQIRFKQYRKRSKTHAPRHCHNFAHLCQNLRYTFESIPDLLVAFFVLFL